MSKPFASAIFKGKVYHKRVTPKLHEFDYNIYLWWIKLSELKELANSFKLFNLNSSSFKTLNFRQDDYFNLKQDAEVDCLEDTVLARMSQLANKELHGDIFFLGQIRTFKMYFSPVNFWFLKNSGGKYTHMLAEVSNTPWNERHHYLVDLETQQDSMKEFHVSPFNPMDMVYKWQVKQPQEKLNLHLSCYKKTKHFEAALDLNRVELSNKSIRKTVLAIPSMTVKTLLGIYWQATKLFFKRVPIYSHSLDVRDKETKDVP